MSQDTIIIINSSFEIPGPIHAIGNMLFVQEIHRTIQFDKLIRQVTMD